MIDYKENNSISFEYCGDSTYGMATGYNSNSVYSRRVYIDPKVMNDEYKMKFVTLHEKRHLNSDKDEYNHRIEVSCLAQDMGLPNFSVIDMSED